MQRSSEPHDLSAMDVSLQSQNDLAVVGSPIVFSGFADEDAGAVTAIQFSLDEGENWTSYPVDAHSHPKGISWRFEFTPSRPGWHCLRIRSLNGSGSPSALVSSIPFLVVDSVEAQDPDKEDLPAKSKPISFSASNHQIDIESCERTLQGQGIHLWSIRGLSPERARVFRSGRLACATEADAGLLQTLGVRTIYDIRTQREVSESPDPLITGIVTVALTPSHEGRRKDASKRLVAGVIGEYGAPEERMRSNYRRYACDYPLIGKALRRMADAKTPCLIHCANGKDRTGVICAVLQAICGMDEEDIYEDYLLYNKLNSDLIEEEALRLGKGMTDEEMLVLRSFIEARASYLDAFFDEIDRRFGDFDTYVEQVLRLSYDQRDSLTSLLM